MGRVTRFTYDAAGNVTSITDAAGNVRTFTYEPAFNRVASITDPLGNVTRFDYDPANGNLLKITDPLGAVTQIAYSSFGQPLSITDALGNISAFAYNAQGDLASVSDPLGNTTARAYDQVSRLVSQTDPRGFTTGFRYDPLNRATETVDALNGVTKLAYDGNGNLLTVTDARGNTIAHAYDTMDRLGQRIDQLGAAGTFSYDGNGNLLATTDRKGQTTTFTYDALDRRTQSAYADGTAATFSYDAAGRLLKADDTADPHRPITLAYDALDRLFAETTSLGTVSYGYDPLGRRTQMTVGGQSPVTYTYDAASRLRTITQAPLSPADIQYDALGRRTLLTLPNGVSTEYQYDAASPLMALIYRNALGLLGDLQYTYDPAGSRTAVGGSFARTLVPDPVSTATYDAANRQLTFGGKTMTLDPNGDLTSITDMSGPSAFTWDARDRLIGISGPTLPAAFQYDALGRRTQKVIGSATAAYQYDGAHIVREVLNGVEANYLRTRTIDEVLGRGGTAFYLAGSLGNSLALTDPTGTPTTEYTYEPFGQTATAGPDANPFQFTGREHDGTGLYYFRRRYYHPELARFISADPLNLAALLIARKQGVVSADAIIKRALRNPALLHEFSYAVNSPINFGDPFGTVPSGLEGAGRAAEAVLTPGGTGETVGGVTLGVAGALGLAALGASTPAAIAGGAVLGLVGGALGSKFDHPCAGQLNCGEEEDLRRWQEKQQFEEFSRRLDETLALVEKLNRIIGVMIEILKSR